MKYITKKHKNKNLYLQFDENNNLSVIYEIKENGKDYLIDNVIVLEKPEYFLLPYINNKENVHYDYEVDCSCFKGLDKVKVVCSGSRIQFTNNNYCDMDLILSKDKSLYGVIVRTRSIRPTLSTKPHGYLSVLHKDFLFGMEESNCTAGIAFLTKTHTFWKSLHYGFTSAPQFDSKCKVRIDRSVVYNNETNSFEETENYDENNMQNVFPDIEDDLTK